MKVRNALIMAGLLAVGALAAPLAGFAQPTEIRIYVESAPPPVKESTPPTTAKVGYVWSDGYWAWNGTAYDWTEGSWIAMVEPAQKWVGATWTQQDEKWYFTAGHWE